MSAIINQIKVQNVTLNSVSANVSPELIFDIFIISVPLEARIVKTGKLRKKYGNACYIYIFSLCQFLVLFVIFQPKNPKRSFT